MTLAWYNEIDPFMADWLEQLIDQGAIARGVVERRSVVDVHGADLEKFSQCHFFAGLGGWSHALRLAGVPDDEPLWTGSVPCQPLSGAGLRQGHVDERHLWPAFFRLIAECRPAVVFGEQVASADGREWLAGVRADLEQLGYAIGAADLPAAGAGAPHKRQRLFWMADDNREGRRQQRVEPPAHQDAPPGRDTHRRGSTGIVVDAVGARLERRPGYGHNSGQSRRLDQIEVGSVATAGDAGFWSAFDILPCIDGKTRRVEPGSFPLADGVSARVGRLRGYGNAIVSQIAATFIIAALDARRLR